MASLDSFRYALKGLKAVISSERNFKIHLVFALIALLASFLLRLSIYEFLFVIISITVVLFAEIINTAIEKTLDLISQESNQKVQLAKDMCAAAVLLTAINALVVAAVIFLPKLFNIIKDFLK